MRNKIAILKVMLIMLLALPAVAFSQGSSINTFSPYTFYGIGDFATQGPAYIRSMGGAGVGYRSPTQINYLNPASMSTIGRQSFIFNMGLEGGGYYSKTASKTTSFNTFNIRDIALQFPLYKKIGLGISVTPYSKVGYRVDMEETDPTILANVGSVTYNYLGQGGITQAKMALGIEVFKNFSLGAELIYYHGQIDRSFSTNINPVISDAKYYNTLGRALEEYSKMAYNVGFQYNVIANENRVLTLGATYQPKFNMKPRISREISTSSIFADTISYSSAKENFYLPSSLTAGLFYQTTKWGFGLDYSTQNWKGINPSDTQNGVQFSNNQSLKVGAQYTPNVADIRSFYKRWTYRAGLRYNDYYMTINDHKINDLAITIGLGIPTKMQGLSAVNVGLELGQRGTTATGIYQTRQFQMVRERYFKVSIGFSLFGEDYWFMKHKYN